MSLYKDRRFEEYAYPLDFIPNARSTTIKKIEGPIVQALGQDYFTFLEILAKEDFTLVVGERIYIGKEGREKISKVLGKIKYADLTENAKNRLPRICKEIVRNDIEKFNSLLNDQLFPLHKISPKEKRPVNLRANSALFEKLVSRILEELSGSIPKNKWIIAGTGGRKWSPRVIGKKAKYWMARGGIPVGKIRYLGKED